MSNLKFLTAGVQCKSEQDGDYRAFVYYVDAHKYPLHSQEDIMEVRGYGDDILSAMVDAVNRYEELEQEL